MHDLYIIPNAPFFDTIRFYNPWSDLKIRKSQNRKDWKQILEAVEGETLEYHLDSYPDNPRL